MPLVLEMRASGRECNTCSDQAIYEENAITHCNFIALFLGIYPKRIVKYIHKSLN